MEASLLSVCIYSSMEQAAWVCVRAELTVGERDEGVDVTTVVRQLMCVLTQDEGWCCSLPHFNLRIICIHYMLRARVNEQHCFSSSHALSLYRCGYLSFFSVRCNCVSPGKKELNCSPEIAMTIILAGAREFVLFKNHIMLTVGERIAIAVEMQETN